MILRVTFLFDIDMTRHDIIWGDFPKDRIHGFANSVPSYPIRHNTLVQGSDNYQHVGLVVNYTLSRRFVYSGIMELF